MKPRKIISRKLSKKADEFMVVVVIIIGLVALLVLGAFIRKVYIDTKTRLEAQTCADSIATHAFMADKTGRDIFTDIKCPTREILVDNTGNQDKAKKTIADDMQRCWYEWGKGSYMLFKGDGAFCHVCSVYDFKDSGNNVDGLIRFLATKKVNPVFSGDVKGLTYMEYMQGYKTPVVSDKLKDFDMTKLSTIDSIDTSKKYASIIVYVSGKKTIEKWLEGGTRTAVFTTGVTLGVVGAVSAVTAGLAGLGLVNVWNPLGWLSLGAAAILSAGILIYNAVDVDDPQWISVVVLRPYNETELEDLGCQYLEANQLSHSIKRKDLK